MFVTAANHGRPTRLARAAALILGLFGLGFVWVGLRVLLSAADPGPVPSQFGQGVRAVFIGAGFLVVVLAAVEVLAAVGVWLGRSWGRILGIIYAIVFGIGSLLTVLSSVGSSTPAAAMAMILAWFVAYAFVGVVLIGRWRRQ
jgi:hypothetical protein